jgi:hypothetical protein
MRHAESCDSNASTVQRKRRLDPGSVYHTDVEGNTRSGTAQRPPQYMEGAALFIEEPPEECRKVRSSFVTRRAGDRKRFLSGLIAQPQEGRQVRNVIRMQMADRDQREVFEPAAGLPKAEKCAAAGVNEDSSLTSNPNEITRRGSIAVHSRTAGTQNLHTDAHRFAGLRRRTRSEHHERRRDRHTNYSVGAD